MAASSRRRSGSDLPSLLLAVAVAGACAAVLVLGVGAESTLLLDPVPEAAWGLDVGAGASSAQDLREAAFTRLRGLLLALSAAAAVVALATALTLEVARGSRSRVPVAIRSALGASPARLRRQLVRARLHPLLVRGLGGGVVMAGVLALLVVVAWPEGSGLPDPTSLGIAAALAAFFGILGVVTALLPLRYGREPLSGVLAAGRAQDDRFEGGLRRVLSVLQIAVTLGVLVGSLGALRALASSSTDQADTPDTQAAAGAETDRTGSPAADSRGAPDAVASPDASKSAATNRTVIAPVSLDPDLPPARRAEIHQEILERARAISTVASESIATPGAWSGVGRSGYVMTECGNCVVGMMLLPLRGEVARQHVVSPGFFQQAGLGILAGRDFAISDRAGAPGVAVVSRSFAERNFEDGDPLGRRLRLERGRQEEWVQVVGVVDEPRIMALGRGEGRAPAVYLPALQHPPDRVELAVTGTGLIPEAVDDLLRDQGLESPGSAQTLTVRRRQEQAPLRWAGRVAAALGLMALLAALPGAHAVARAEVDARRRALGIRAALGSDRRGLLLWVLVRSGRAAALGVVLGLPLAVAVAGHLREVASGLPLLDPVGFAVLALLVAGAALAGALGPARDAADTDPARVLAGE